MTTRDEARYRRDFRLEAEPVLDEARGRYERLVAAGGEPDPNDLNALFRAVHSLKGSAAMVGLTGLSAVAHVLEALLDALRMGRVPLDPPSLSAVRDGLSTLADVTVRVGGDDEDPAAAAASVDALRKAAAPRRAEPEAQGPSIHLPADVASALTDYERHRFQENLKKGRDFLVVSLELPFDGFDEGLRTAMAEAGAAGELIGTFPGAASSADSLSFRLLVGVRPETDAAALAARCGADAIERFAAERPAPAPAPLLDEALAKLGGAVRVPLPKLNQLLDVAGELALARSALENALERHLALPGDRTARTETQRAFRL
ncbi:MAG TPA: Hpt domain-containing protein, partial [Thermoanaerobaculia bacterium]|nr:Hpt domain-containing protein [Thermoanaerobaculia bacterium]